MKRESAVGSGSASTNSLPGSLQKGCNFSVAAPADSLLCVVNIIATNQLAGPLSPVNLLGCVRGRTGSRSVSRENRNFLYPIHEGTEVDPVFGTRSLVG